MLAVTDRAGEVIRAIAGQADLPDGSGLRIAAEPPQMSDNGSSPPDGTSLRLAVVADGETGDQVVSVPGGGQVFLEPDVVDVLDDKVLDAGVDQEGKLAFQLTAQ